MNIAMRLSSEPFSNIRNGQKTVEIRIYDKKRQQIKVGDAITFYCLSDKTDCITVTVTALHRFDGFKQLFSSELFSKTGSGSMTINEATESMYKYYSQQQEQQFGVIGIEIQKMD